MPRKQRTEDIFEPSSDCPSVEELVAFSEGPRDAEQSDAFHAHLAACPRCQSELALIASFQEADATPHEEADLGWMLDRLPRAYGVQNEATANRSVRPSIWKQWRSWWSALNVFRPIPVLTAVAALLVLGIGIREMTTTAPELRLPGDTLESGGAMRGNKIRLLTPLTHIESLPANLEWESVDGATSYEVIVRYVDGAVALRFSSSQNRAEWPESLRALTTPGRSLFIEVSALDRAGRKLATSERQVLKLNGN